MEDWPPELAHKIAYSGLLTQEDVLSLCCASRAICQMLVGDEYGENHFKSLAGPRICAQYQRWTAVRFALVRGEPLTQDVVHLLCRSTTERDCLFDYLLKRLDFRPTYNDLKRLAENDRIDLLKRCCVHVGVENLEPESAGCVFLSCDDDFIQEFVRTKGIPAGYGSLEEIIRAIQKRNRPNLLDLVVKECLLRETVNIGYIFSSLLDNAAYDLFLYAEQKYPKQSKMRLLESAVFLYERPEILYKVMKWPGATDRMVRQAINEVTTSCKNNFPIAQLRRLLTHPALDLDRRMHIDNRMAPHLVPTLREFPFIRPPKRKRDDTSTGPSKKQKPIS